ncbi:ricin-type beta-trefoil lectin domain protein [Streptomyces sp. NPDC048473]|uniref:ricin-type beta-trefoil lectin domain protein n=1 Tax=unclassified Streptomyces TaxID=2593676 RepID=UPI003720B0F5
MRHDFKAAVVVCALTAATTLGFASTPANAALMSFRLKNQTTGKCLKWNGYNKPVTQVSCAKAKSQYWGVGGTHLVSLATPLVGEGCLTGPSKHEGRVYGRACSKMKGNRISWNLYSHNNNSKNTPWNPVGGYLKVSKSGKVVAGARVSGNRDVWIVKT